MRREIIVVSGGIESDSLPHRLEVSGADNFSCGLSRLVESGEQYAGKDRDNGDRYQELYEGEVFCSVCFHAFLLILF